MKQTNLEAYIKALKKQYHLEKEGMYSEYLEQPSRANLRKLCVERFKSNARQEDLVTFKIFFGFDFNGESLNKLKAETDRFRAIENFIIGKTETNDLKSLNLIAILLDFNPRPFQKFAKQDHSQVTVLNNTNLEDTSDEVVPSSAAITYRKSKKTRNITIIVLAILSLFTAGYTAKDLIYPNKECMQWQINHYQLIDCTTESNNTKYDAPIIPIDKYNAELNKIKVTESTTFFKNGKAVVWYCKMKPKELEYFDQAGFHPISNKPLKPITKYMINKYIKKKPTK